MEKEEEYFIDFFFSFFSVVIKKVLLFKEMSRSMHISNAMYIKIYMKVPSYSCIPLLHNGKQAKFILMLTLVKYFILFEKSYYKHCLVFFWVLHIINI